MKPHKKMAKKTRVLSQTDDSRSRGVRIARVAEEKLDLSVKRAVLPAVSAESACLISIACSHSMPVRRSVSSRV